MNFILATFLRAFSRLKQEVLANQKARPETIRGRFWELLKEERERLKQ